MTIEQIENNNNRENLNGFFLFVMQVINMYELFFKYYDITKEGVVINLKTNRKYKGTIANNGYLHWQTTKNNKHYDWSIHRLIAIKYIPNPNNYPIINHIDGNKLNNLVSNLEWCTSSENKIHAFSLGLMTQKGSYNVMSKLDEEKVEEI